MLANTSSKYDRLSPAARRVYDALDDEGRCSRKTLQQHTHHSESRVRDALRELREADLAERVGSWPVPEYALAE